MLLQFRNLIRLATHDYFREWKISMCFILALAAVLGPMMILFGLKHGIITGLFDQLKDNPQALEIRSVSSGRYDAGWMESIRQHPSVKFIIPVTRKISSNLQLKSKSSSEIITVTLIPTADDDPLLPDIDNINSKQMVLSATVADKLNVSPGDIIDASLARQQNGKRERKHFNIEVTAIAAENTTAKDTAFVSLPFAYWVDDFRKNLEKSDSPYEVSVSGSMSKVGPTRVSPGFRLYANSVYDIETLTKQLTDAGIKVKTQAKDIQLIKSMDTNISHIYWIIAALGLGGFALSLGASLWANIDRKRRDLSILRLVGFNTGGIIWFPIIQAFYTAFLGWMFATYVYFGVAYAINQRFADKLEGDKVCHLLPEHVALALGITVIASVLAAILAGWRAASIEPSKSLREN